MTSNLNYKADGTGLSESDLLDLVAKTKNIDYDALRYSISDLLPLDDFDNIEMAANIVKETISSGGTFCIQADVDQDGISSCAIIYRYLKHFTDNVKTLINDGKDHSVSSVDLSELDGVDTYIIVDSMLDETETYKKILETGTKLIILDHHTPVQEVIDIAKDICLVSSAVNYGNPELSGAGVCLKFCMYLDREFLENYSSDLYDLAACGIVADVCSMKSAENRYIVNRGLNNPVNTAFKLMVGPREFNATAIQFSVAPYVNACVRMGKNREALQMFLTDDYFEVGELYEVAKQCREDQNLLVSELVPIVEEQFSSQLSQNFLYANVDKKFQNVCGVVASKLVEKYQRPIFVTHTDGDKIGGSMRAKGIDDFSGFVNEMGIASCNGHPQAAGFHCDTDKEQLFKEKLQEKIKNVKLDTTVYADILVDKTQLTPNFVKNIKLVDRISGKDFEKVRFAIDVSDCEVGNMSQGKHTKLTYSKIPLIIPKWNDDSWKEWQKTGTKPNHAVGTLDFATYGRSKYIQLTADYFV